MSETDPTGKAGMDHGAKLDGGKNDLTLVPPELEFAAGLVLTAGLDKYARCGWLGVDPRRPFASMERHLKAFKAGEDIDPQSGLHHLYHVAANLSMLLHFYARGDDIGAWRLSQGQCGIMGQDKAQT